MPSIINASTSTGLVTTADTSGVLQLQTGGTTALAVSAAQVVTLTNPLPVASGGSGGTTSTGSGANVLGTTPSFTSTIGVGGATASASGAGITFPATQSASTDVNTLDDYEEGTWTPVPTSTGATFTSNAEGQYTKIGRMVYFKCFVDNSASPTGTLTNEMTIAGLPLSESGGYGASVAIGFMVNIDWPTAAKQLVARVTASSTQITLMWSEDDAGGLDFLASAFDASDARIAIAGCYQV